MTKLSKQDQKLIDEAYSKLKFASERVSTCLSIYESYLNLVNANAKIESYQLLYEIDYISKDILDCCERCLNLLTTANAKDNTKKDLKFTNDDLLNEAIKAASVFFKNDSPIINTDSIVAYLLSDLTDAARENLLWLLMKNQAKEKLHTIIKPGNSKDIFIAKWNPYLSNTPVNKTFCEITFIFSQNQPKVVFLIKEV